MAKNIPDAIKDLQLAQCEGDKIHYLSAEPANFSEVSTYELAQDDLSGGNYAKANGDVNGRKNTLTPPSDSDIDTTGVCTHVAVTSGGDTLRKVTTCTSQALTSGGTVTGQPFDHEIGDPS